MAGKRVLSFYMRKSDKQWVAELRRDGTRVFSPRMQDAELFPGRRDSINFPGREYKHEWVEVRPFSPPSPKAKRKPAKKKAKATAVAEPVG